MARLVIRVDGDSGNEAGMGHVYRSLAYARELSAVIPDLNIHFLMRRFLEGIRKVAENGYPITVLPPQPTPADYQKNLHRLRPDVLIIDTLGSNDTLIDAARKSSAVIITLDDLTPSARYTDIIINGIVWATEWLPDKFGMADVYQGVEYLQLREQFSVANQIKRDIAPVTRTILISTGGADGREFTPQLMEAVARSNFIHDIVVNVVIGPAFQNKPMIEQLNQRGNSQIHFHLIENTQDMATLILQSDLALITGGTVMFESAACGTPAIIVCSYEHQVPQAKWFAERNIVRNLGYFPGTIDVAWTAEEISRLTIERETRIHMSALGRATVDGKGIFRVAEIVRRELMRMNA